MTFCLPVEEVIATNRAIERERHILLDRGKLESALARPIMSFDGRALYPTVVERAAVLLESLAAAHAFMDGNKRTAWISCNIYLGAFGVVLRDLPADLAGGVVLGLTTHAYDVKFVARWIADNTE